VKHIDQFLTNSHLLINLFYVIVSFFLLFFNIFQSRTANLRQASD